MSQNLDNVQLIKLIESIVREVLIEKGFLTIDGSYGSLSSDVKNSTKLYVIALFTGTNLFWDEISKQIVNLSSCLDIHAIVTSGFLNYFSVDELKNKFPQIKFSVKLSEKQISEEINKAGGLIIPFLSRNTAVKTALAITDSLASNVFFQMIANGKKIVAVNSGIDPDAKECPLLFNLPLYFKSILRDYIKTLKQCGVFLVEPAQFYDEVQNVFCTNINSPKFKSNKTIITVNDIVDYLKTSQENKICIPKNSIITPAALDFAAENSITISKE